MYKKAAVERYGSFRELTLAGCSGPSDGVTGTGGVATGSTPIIGANGEPTVCFAPAPGSR